VSRALLPQWTWDELQAKAIPEPNSGCLLWLGPYSSGGYGNVYDRDDRKSNGAHRLSYKLNKGPIPLGMCVCHQCDVPECINPEHLFLGTTQDNTADMIAKGRNYVPTSAKISDDQVMLIFSDPRKYSAICKDFSVTMSTVSLIKSGGQWARVTGKSHKPKTHCANGHPWIDENIGETTTKRYCKMCNRERRLANYYRGKVRR
jgi:hypothetical protein